MKAIRPLEKTSKNSKSTGWRELTPRWLFITMPIVFLLWLPRGPKEAVATMLMIGAILLLVLIVIKWSMTQTVPRIIAIAVMIALFNAGGSMLAQVRESEQQQTANTHEQSNITANDQKEESQPQKEQQPEQPKPEENLAQDVNYKAGERAVVSRIVDGDTIYTDKYKIRIIGIDTPETKHPNKPVECFGAEASQKMSELVDQKAVYLVADPTQDSVDKYGRRLYHIYLDNGMNVAYQMIRDGYGHEYTYNSNPHKWQSQFREAQRLAREEGRGLWSSNTCSGNTSQPAKTGQPAATPQQTPAQNQPAQQELRFSNCKEARAAGYSHMRKGEPGYSSSLDRDGDGIACDKSS